MTAINAHEALMTYCNILRGNRSMNTKQAAQYLEYSEITLRRARQYGMLAGVEAPRYIKRGNRVIYHAEDLDEWASRFKKITNTAQNSISP